MGEHRNPDPTGDRLLPDLAFTKSLNMGLVSYSLGSNSGTPHWPVVGQELIPLGLHSLLCEEKDNSTSLGGLDVGVHSDRRGKKCSSHCTDNISLPPNWRPLGCFIFFSYSHLNVIDVDRIKN